MNKLLFRLVALFLVPCLIADPVTAAAFSESLLPNDPPINARRFQEEALEASLLFQPLHNLLSDQLKARAVRMAEDWTEIFYRQHPYLYAMRQTFANALNPAFARHARPTRGEKPPERHGRQILKKSAKSSLLVDNAKRSLSAMGYAAEKMWFMPTKLINKVKPHVYTQELAAELNRIYGDPRKLRGGGYSLGEERATVERALKSMIVQGPLNRFWLHRHLNFKRKPFATSVHLPLRLDGSLDAATELTAEGEKHPYRIFQRVQGVIPDDSLGWMMEEGSTITPYERKVVKQEIHRRLADPKSSADTLGMVITPGAEGLWAFPHTPWKLEEQNRPLERVRIDPGSGLLVMYVGDLEDTPPLNQFQALLQKPAYSILTKQGEEYLPLQQSTAESLAQELKVAALSEGGIQKKSAGRQTRSYHAESTSYASEYFHNPFFVEPDPASLTDFSRADRGLIFKGYRQEPDDGKSKPIDYSGTPLRRRLEALADEAVRRSGIKAYKIILFGGQVWGERRTSQDEIDPAGPDIDLFIDGPDKDPDVQRLRDTLLMLGEERELPLHIVNADVVFDFTKSFPNAPAEYWSYAQASGSIDAESELNARALARIRRDGVTLYPRHNDRSASTKWTIFPHHKFYVRWLAWLESPALTFTMWLNWGFGSELQKQLGWLGALYVKGVVLHLLFYGLHYLVHYVLRWTSDAYRHAPPRINPYSLLLAHTAAYVAGVMGGLTVFLLFAASGGNMEAYNPFSDLVLIGYGIAHLLIRHGQNQDTRPGNPTDKDSGSMQHNAKSIAAGGNLLMRAA